MSIIDSYIGLDTVKFAPIAFTADGDNTAVAAVSGRKIRVIGYVLSCQTTAGLVTLKDTGATYATFALIVGSNVSYSGGLAAPAFETSAGLALTLNNGAGVDTYGHITYITI